MTRASLFSDGAFFARASIFSTSLLWGLPYRNPFADQSSENDLLGKLFEQQSQKGF